MYLTYENTEEMWFCGSYRKAIAFMYVYVSYWLCPPSHSIHPVESKETKPSIIIRHIL